MGVFLIGVRSQLIASYNLFITSRFSASLQLLLWVFLHVEHRHLITTVAKTKSYPGLCLPFCTCGVDRGRCQFVPCRYPFHNEGTYSANHTLTNF